LNHNKWREHKESIVGNTLQERNIHKLMRKRFGNTSLGLRRHGEKELELSNEEWLVQDEEEKT
jgi:hypothetical protein